MQLGSIKYRNAMDLTEAEDIKKQWQEYTEKLYKNDLHKKTKKQTKTKKIIITQITTTV